MMAADTKGSMELTLHIDTSLQIERCKKPEKAKKVEKCLAGFAFKTTSTYAKMEFKRAWLRDLAYLYRSTNDVETVGDLIGYLNDKLNATPFNRRRLSRCLEGICKYMGQLPDGVSNKAALIRLRSFLRRGILGAYDWWENSVHHEFDNIRCERANERPASRPGGKIDVSIPQCRNGKANCAIATFFQENLSLFESIKNCIDENSDSSDELKKSSERIGKSFQNPNLLCEDVCAEIGDILIALDGKAMSAFGANNDKEWLFLSRHLNKKLVNPIR